MISKFLLPGDDQELFFLLKMMVTVVIDITLKRHQKADHIVDVDDCSKM